MQDLTLNVNSEPKRYLEIDYHRLRQLNEFKATYSTNLDTQGIDLNAY